MKVTLKDLLRHKFPMDETEQAVLLKELSDLKKELREKLKAYEASAATVDLIFQHRADVTKEVIREILGES